MFWVDVLILLFAQVAGSLPSPSVPEAAGVYFRQDNAGWIVLQPAVVSDADAKGMKLFVYTGGYTDLGMHVACRGPRAAIRILLQKPTFYVRDIGSSKDALIVRLTQKKDSRKFKTSFSNVTVENKAGFDKQDIFALAPSGNPDGYFALSPERNLPPGEYLLVFGSVSTAYDFGVDKAK